MRIIITESQKNILMNSIDSDLIYIKKTPKKGYSLFSKKEINKNEEIGKIISKTQNNNERELSKGFFETRIIGRYINHSNNPNTKLKSKNDEYFLVAIKNIKKDQEITVNYGLIEKILGVKTGTFLLNGFLD